MSRALRGFLLGFGVGLLAITLAMLNGIYFLYPSHSVTIEKTKTLVSKLIETQTKTVTYTKQRVSLVFVYRTKTMYKTIYRATTKTCISTKPLTYTMTIPKVYTTTTTVRETKTLTRVKVAILNITVEKLVPITVVREHTKLYTKSITFVKTVEKTKTISVTKTVTNTITETITIPVYMNTTAIANLYHFKYKYAELEVNGTHVKVSLGGLLYDVSFCDRQFKHCYTMYAAYPPYVDWAYIDKSKSIVVINLTRVHPYIPRGKVIFSVSTGFAPYYGSVVLWCELDVNNRTIVFFKCHKWIHPATLKCRYRLLGNHVIDILCGFNWSDIQYVGKKIFGESIPRDKSVAIYKIEKWMKDHFIYNASIEGCGALLFSPREIIDRGVQGVCLDYATVCAAALLYAGFNESAILVVFLPIHPLPHTVAMTYINGVPVVLEQGEWFMELADYLQLTSAEVLQMFKIVKMGNESIAVEIIGDPNLIMHEDMYPDDRLPRSLSIDIIRALERKYNITADPRLAGLVESGINFTDAISIPRYLHIVYTPVLRKAFAEYIADLIWRWINDSVTPGKSHFWLCIDEETDMFLVITTDYVYPDTSIFVEGDRIVIEVNASENIDSIDILLANVRNVRYNDAIERVVDFIAAIAPNERHYMWIPTVIKASKWIVEDGKARIEVPIDVLKAKVSMNRFIVVVYVKLKSWPSKMPIYAKSIELKSP